MNRSELYKKTIDIFFDAYFNDTLHYGCEACVIGNLIAANKGIKIVKNGNDKFKWEGYINERGLTIGDEQLPAWGVVFGTISKSQFLRIGNYVGQAKDDIDSTGYTLPELALMEYSYETAIGETIKDRIFNGLSAVLETLNKIHEVEHESTYPIRTNQRTLCP